MTTTIVHVCRTLTAAAAIFTLLGACGIPIDHRQPVRRPRPLPPMSTIRSLTGTWSGIAGSAAAPGPALILTLRQRGLRVTGVLALDDRILATIDDPPAEIDTYGRIDLLFAQATTQVGLRLMVDTTGDRMTGAITGVASEPQAVSLVRR